MSMLKVYIGYDSREAAAYNVAHYSLMRHASRLPSVTPLNIAQLNRQGLMVRPVRTGENGEMWDVISNAPQSTEFATSRFLTPLLAQTGWALFVDSDVVFLRDVHEIFENVTGATKAVYVVKHNYVPSSDFKMDGQVQTQYLRKNWSSVMLFNCDHPANLRLTSHLINTLPGRDLHRFCWLRDSDIGELGAGWNWLVGEQPMPEKLGVAHFTLGGPWLPNWKPSKHDEIWSQNFEALSDMRKGAFAAAKTTG